MAAFFSFGLGIGRKEGKDEGLEQTICKAFKVRLRLFFEDFVELKESPTLSLSARHAIGFGQVDKYVNPIVPLFYQLSLLTL